MKKFLFASLFAMFLPTFCFGQHADVEFGFDDLANPTTIEVELTETTSDGIQIAESEFEEVFIGDPETDDPGFITPADEGLLVNQDDEVSIRFLNAAQNSDAGVGFVNFYNPATGQLEPSGIITITNELGDEVVLDGSSISGAAATLFLDDGSDGFEFSNAPDEPAELLGIGEIHNHLTFDLDNATAQDGAFGLLLQFEADLNSAINGPDGIVDVTSDPFFLIFNNNLSEEDFETLAIPAFSVVPEPSAAIVLSALAGGILTRRRRRI